MNERHRFATFAILAALQMVTPGPVAAGEICIAFGSAAGCEPGTQNLTSFGFSTDGTPCTTTPCSPARQVWSFSLSATDPYENSGPLPPDKGLYLWVVCAGHDETSGGVGDFSGDLRPVAFEPSAGVPVTGIFDAHLVLVRRQLRGGACAGATGQADHARGARLCLRGPTV